MSYSDVQGLAPELEVRSARTPSDFASCIMPKARERWASQSSIGPDGAAQVLTIALDGTRMLATLTISPDGAGSRVAYRTTTRAGRFTEFSNDIAACV